MPKSDHDIERLVEDWLDEEARAMPHHVLESSLEAVARATQVGAARPLRARWFSQRGLTFAIAAGAIVLAIAAGPTIVGDLGGLIGQVPGGGPRGSAPEILVWNPATDFLVSPDQQNPSPDQYGNRQVWRYLRSETNSNDPATFLLLPNFNPDQTSWYERDLVNLVVGYSAIQNTINLHGWADGNRSHNHHAILGWRSPVSGTVHLRGAAWSPTPSCPEPADGPTLTIQLDGAMVANYPLGLGGTKDLNLILEVEAGQSLYFSNDPGLDARCDNIFLRLTITATN